MYVIDPDQDCEPAVAQEYVLIDNHVLDPMKVLRLVPTMGQQVKHLLIVGCEPSPPAEDGEMEMELSQAVSAAVGEAVALIESLVGRILGNGRVGYA